MTINWFPGHMVKARREITQNLKLVDVVVVLLDARAPFSCINPELEKMTGNKKVVYILNKADLADAAQTRAYLKKFKEEGRTALAVSSTRSQGVHESVEALMAAFKERQKSLMAKGRRARAVRVMVVGLPNVGKSSFLNSVMGKGIAVTGAKPGVTRGKQWIRLREDVEMMDTPGIMWPKIDSEEQGIKLALLSIIGDNAFDIIEVASYLVEVLRRNNDETVLGKYQVGEISGEAGRGPGGPGSQTRAPAKGRRTGYCQNQPGAGAGISRRQSRALQPGLNQELIAVA